MTNDIEAGIHELMTKIADLGGAVAAIEQGFQKAGIERSAYAVARQIDSGERVIVGVNAFTTEGEEPYQPLRLDPAVEQQQRDRVAAVRERRDNAELQRRLAELKQATAGTGNLLYPMREALRARATVGEVCDALRETWGLYSPVDVY